MTNLDYQSEAAQFIVDNNITDFENIKGVVIYAYLLIVENKTMHNFCDEANKYCYQLTDGTIGTLPKEPTDRISKEVLEFSEKIKNAQKIEK